jgi:hypothetical protein
MVMIGLMTFIVGLVGEHPGRAWQAYLINFLLWSAVAQGGLLFSTIMHVARARWSGALSGLSGAFAAFFPISFILFLILFLGHGYVFPWAHHELHGKEAWLNLPFLFSRDVVGLALLYGLGFAFLYHALWFRLGDSTGRGRIRTWLQRRWAADMVDEEKCRQRMTLFSILYMLAFAVILSLIGYDLVMAMDPHWYSTLFGAYTFVKAIYAGLGGLIILAAALHLSKRTAFGLDQSQFHDIGKLFFAFCLVWADFFYCQFVVIWYGNIPEETAYIVERTMTAPWNRLAWTVFIVSFILPFLILINKKIKTMPKAMIVICAAVLAGIWLEHHLLIAPAMERGHASLDLGLSDVLICLGFLGLMAFALAFYLKTFPELVTPAGKEVN